MLRSFAVAAVAALALTTVGCSASTDAVDGDDEGGAYVLIRNQDTFAYTIYANGTRIGRVGSSSTRRLSLANISLEGPVEFLGRSTSGQEVSWPAEVVSEVRPLELTIYARRDF